MIPKATINSYLARALEDHRWIKQMTEADLDDCLNDLRPRPQLFKGMRWHQKACFLLGVVHPQFLYWVDMGGGKTLIALELLKYWRMCDQLRRALILVTTDKAYPTWQNQMKKFNINIPSVFLQGDSEDKWMQLDDFDTGLVVCHRPGAAAMVSKLQKQEKKSNKKRKVEDDLIERLGWHLDGVVWDEITRDAHHTSLVHKVGRKLSRIANVRYGLAGRPFGRDPALVWGEYYLVDGGDTFGDTLGLFRGAFCDELPDERSSNKYAVEYKFNTDFMPKLTDMMQHRSITFSEGELPDLPEMTPIIEPVRLPEEAGIYYKRLVKQIIGAKGNLQEMKSVFMRMRQLSSGFIGMRDDETGERCEIEFEKNPKLDRTLELLGQLPQGRKALVFYDFTYSGRKLNEGLVHMEMEPVWMWSGTEDSLDEMKRFMTDDNCRIMVLNSKIGAYSLDGLQDVANYTFFYESPVGVIDRQQAERRLRRDGQPRHVFQYDMVALGTADEKILDFHAEGKELFGAFANPENIFG